MKKLYGNTRGLKASQLKRLDKLYSRGFSPDYLVSPEVAKELCSLSSQLRRQIGLLISRSGKIKYVLVGNDRGIFIPDLSDYRLAPGRLRGLRCIHTHLKNEPLTRDDLTDLALLRLDMMVAITFSDNGLPGTIFAAHILPSDREQKPYVILEPFHQNQLNMECRNLIRALESELSQKKRVLKSHSGRERALLVSISTHPRKRATASMDELRELVTSASIDIVDTVIQLRKKVHPNYLMGKGKLEDLAIYAMQQEVSILIFDQDLNPSQIKSITDLIEIKVVDRTQLILDIFAQRAQTREGKLQVELAQLKYLLPRLVLKNTAMSRLTGGIGGRGPGETKLEINRRRVRDRIKNLEKALKSVIKQRKQQRRRRERKGLPIISIIGYTNAGKSTLLNTLTKSNVLAEKKLFATLDPSSRRLRFPRDIEVIITDTVGFIENLPKDLMVAFRATLEELESADLLVHVIDISNPRCREQVDSVNKILSDLNLNSIPIILALNKKDRVDAASLISFEKEFKGVAISAKDSSTLFGLLNKMENVIEPLTTTEVHPITNPELP